MIFTGFVSKEQANEQLGEQPLKFTGKYHYVGSNALEPIFKSSIEAFTKLHPDDRVSCNASGYDGNRLQACKGFSFVRKGLVSSFIYSGQGRYIVRKSFCYGNDTKYNYIANKFCNKQAHWPFGQDAWLRSA